MIKLDVRTEADGSVHAALVGKIDEHFDGAAVLGPARNARQVILKLDGVRAISSLGVRAFEQFIRALGDRPVLLDDISPALANQLSMIPNLLGHAEVRSARLPFVCPACGAERLHSIPYHEQAVETHAPTCDCGKKMEFDGFSEEYLPHGR